MLKSWTQKPYSVMWGGRNRVAHKLAELVARDGHFSDGFGHRSNLVRTDFAGEFEKVARGAVVIEDVLLDVAAAGPFRDVELAEPTFEPDSVQPVPELVRPNRKRLAVGVEQSETREDRPDSVIDTVSQSCRDVLVGHCLDHQRVGGAVRVEEVDWDDAQSFVPCHARLDVIDGEVARQISEHGALEVGEADAAFFKLSSVRFQPGPDVAAPRLFGEAQQLRDPLSSQGRPEAAGTRNRVAERRDQGSRHTIAPPTWRPL